MNKQEFMNILQARLAHVNPAWRDEVLSDLDEHFVQAAANGCSEEEAAAHLGDPVELAQQFYEEAASAGRASGRSFGDLQGSRCDHTAPCGKEFS